MRELIKFFCLKDYAEMFKAGKLYMNSLAYFWNNGFEEQRDIFEGITDSIDKDKIDLPIDLKQVINGEILFRLEAYQYCNLYCLYRVDISDNLIWNKSEKNVFPDTREIMLPDNDMSKFGEYVGIVKNEEEFIKRVLRAVDKSTLCLTGDVRYKKRKGMDKARPNGIVFGMKELYPVSQWVKDGIDVINSRDCFEKLKKYEKQKEWRICLFRGGRDESAYILDVGDLSDIVDIIKINEIRDYFIRKYSPCINNYVSPQYGGFKGNISRKDFKEEIYKYDGGKGRLMFIV